VRLTIGVLGRSSRGWLRGGDRGVGGEILPTLRHNDNGVFMFIVVACRVERNLSAFFQMIIANTLVFGGLVLGGCVSGGISIARNRRLTDLSRDRSRGGDNEGTAIVTRKSTGADDRGRRICWPRFDASTDLIALRVSR